MSKEYCQELRKRDIKKRKWGGGGDHICKTLWDERSNKSEEKEAKVFEQVTNSYVRTTVSEVARMKRRHTVANSTYV